MTARSKRIRRTLGVLALVLTPTVLFAVQRRPVGGSGSPLFQRAAQRLDLSTEQLAEIKAILKSHAAELQAETATLVAARRTLWNAIHAETANPNAIRAAGAAVGTGEGALGVTRSKIVGEVRAVLTPEQQAELQTLLADAQAFLQDMLVRVQQRFTDFVG
jgi:Spy/CpxP family protein refolding chaperone